MKRTNILRIIFVYGIVAVALLTVAFLIGGCSTPQGNAIATAQAQAEQMTWYVPNHPQDPANYNRRLQRLDDPATILWCTYYPPTAGYKPLTFAVQGKLTSSNKRPFPQNSNSYEQADAQSMYGSSSEYRYGFSPDGTYWEVYPDGICTDQPTLVATVGTLMVTSFDPNSALYKAEVAAHDALKANDPTKATQILNDAINQINAGGK